MQCCLRSRNRFFFNPQPNPQSAILLSPVVFVEVASASLVVPAIYSKAGKSDCY
jgi:hypothetical protein